MLHHNPPKADDLHICQITNRTEEQAKFKPQPEPMSKLGDGAKWRCMFNNPLITVLFMSALQALFMALVRWLQP